MDLNRTSELEERGLIPSIWYVLGPHNSVVNQIYPQFAPFQAIHGIVWTTHGAYMLRNGPVTSFMGLNMSLTMSQHTQTNHNLATYM